MKKMMKIKMKKKIAFQAEELRQEWRTAKMRKKKKKTRNRLPLKKAKTKGKTKDRLSTERMQTRD